MIEERGTIISKTNGIVKVRLKRKESCEGCHACMMGENGLYMVTEAENTLNASVGDFVRIQAKGTSKIKTAFILYIAPLLLFIPGFLIGKSWLAPLFSIPADIPQAQLTGFFSGLLLFCSPYIILYLLNKKRKQKPFFKTVEILDN
jgi:sigma-E factor negative regulatory protein RseC